MDRKEKLKLSENAVLRATEPTNVDSSNPHLILTVRVGRLR